ncbi:MAG: hypothetical protein AABZ33_07655 [Chloroflexota bacterium]
MSKSPVSGVSRLCAVCHAVLATPVGRGKPSPYCGPRCRDAARRLRAEIRFWERTVAGWEPIDNARQLAWCRARLDRARAVPPAFFLDPANRWTLRS